jgi:glucokinase
MPKNPSNESLVFAVDLGGTHLRVALVDDTGTIVQQVKQETPKGDSADSIIDALVSAAKKWGAHQRSIVAASIMVPGTVDSTKTAVLQAPNLPSVVGFRLKPELEQRLGWPVLLENDANAAAIGEMWLGAARGYQDVISVTLGTGVGGGVILDGKLWRGSHGGAGEIGHTTVDPFSGLKCKCGKTGCLELFASATAIVRMTREKFSLFPESVLKTVLKSGELSAVKVYEAGRNGDELALEVFRQFGMYLGIGLANLINLIDPQIIVLAGGAANGWDLFAPEMYRQVGQRASCAAALEVKIARAECGDNAGLLGAARLGFQTRLQDFHD